MDWLKKVHLNRRKGIQHPLCSGMQTYALQPFSSQCIWKTHRIQENATLNSQLHSTVSTTAPEVGRAMGLGHRGWCRLGIHCRGPLSGLFSEPASHSSRNSLRQSLLGKLLFVQLLKSQVKLHSVCLSVLNGEESDYGKIKALEEPRYKQRKAGPSEQHGWQRTASRC